MRPGVRLLVAAAVLLAATGTAIAADNTAPLADAGVDQTVTVNGTVYLDGNASVDPDGDITRVEWSVETPDGTTTTPDCADCRRTEFTATAVGQYTVTLTVTDDDGAARSDTLYVTVTNESGPDISLSGPSSTRPGTDATFTANVSANDASLQTLTWLVNGSVVERNSLDGGSVSRSFTHSFDNTTRVRAVAYDTLGNRGSATLRIPVISGGGGTTGGGSGCYATWCGGTGADMRRTVGGTTTITDTNNQDGLQTYNDENELVTIEDPQGNPNIERGNNAEWRIDGGLSELSDSAFKQDDSQTDGSNVPSSSDGSSDADESDDSGIDPSNPLYDAVQARDDNDDSSDDSGGGGSDDRNSTSDAGPINDGGYRSGPMF